MYTSGKEFWKNSGIFLTTISNNNQTEWATNGKYIIGIATTGHKKNHVIRLRSKMLGENMKLKNNHTVTCFINNSSSLQSWIESGHIWDIPIIPICFHYTLSIYNISTVYIHTQTHILYIYFPLYIIRSSSMI